MERYMGLMGEQKSMTITLLMQHFDKAKPGITNLTSNICQEKQNLKSKSFDVKCITEEYFEYLLSTNTYESHFFGDVSNSSALLSLNSLALLSMCNESWIKLEKVESTADETKHRETNMGNVEFLDNEYFVQCLVVSSIKNNNVLYVTKQKYFDIMNSFYGNHLTNKSVKVWISGCECVPKRATNLVLGFINCGTDVKTTYLDIIIRIYFKSERYVKMDEVLEVDLQKILPYVGKSVPHVNVKKLYFKVLNVTDGSDKPSEFGYYIVHNSTHIDIRSDENSYLPMKYTKFVYVNGKIGYEIPICPGGMEKYFDKLQELFLVFLTGGESRLKPMIMLNGARGSGKKTVVKCVASTLGLNFFHMNCFDFVRLDGPAFESKLRSSITASRKAAPTILYMDNIDLMGKDEKNIEDVQVMEVFQREMDQNFGMKSYYPTIVVGSCCKKIPEMIPSVERMFIQTVSFKALKGNEAEKLLDWLVLEAGMTCHPEVVKSVAGRLNGYLFADVAKLIRIALNYQRNDESVTEKTKLLLTMEHMEKAIGDMEGHYSDAIGSAKVPSVHWDDVGGLDKLKEEITLSLNFPTNHPELMAAGLKVSGFLFYGPPGTGKTLMAKAVATEFNYNFLSVKGPELMNMYVGQSEKNVREVFQRAREAAPCIIFFDEIDSLAPNRGRDSSIVMDRIVSQLLTEMDGLESNAGVFVIGATNRPDLVDPGLLRPGRFDKMFYVGICSTMEMKLSVIKAVTRKFALEDDVNLKAVAEQLPDQVTGADVYSICSNSWLEAARRRIHQMNKGKRAIELPVTVNMEDFKKALAMFVPSLTPEVIQSYEKFKPLER